MQCVRNDKAGNTKKEKEKEPEQMKTSRILESDKEKSLENGLLKQ